MLNPKNFTLPVQIIIVIILTLVFLMLANDGWLFNIVNQCLMNPVVAIILLSSMLAFTIYTRGSEIFSNISKMSSNATTQQPIDPNALPNLNQTMPRANTSSRISSVSELEGQQVYQHALDAVRAARLEKSMDLPLLVTDIGFIVHYGENGVHLHRINPILVSADAIQPYVELFIHEQGQWTIGFEIIDQHDLLIFQHVAGRYVGQGQRWVVTPPAHLPVKRFHPTAARHWMLRVRANGHLIAVHHFAWRSEYVTQVKGNIDSDGEIDESILPLLANNYAQPMSLDDLLARDDSNAKAGKN